jgi:hypothetical protein
MTHRSQRHHSADAGFDVDTNAATITDATARGQAPFSPARAAERLPDEVVGLRKLAGIPT